MAVLLMAERPDCDIGAFFQFKGDLGVEGFAQGLACQIDASAAGAHPAETCIEVLGVFLILPAAHHHFAQIVEARPDEITDQSGILLRQLPEFIGIKAEGFAAQNQPVGIFLQILFIALFPIVVPGNIHIGKGFPGGHIAAVEGGTDFHEVGTQDARHVIEKFGAGGAFLGLFPFRFGFRRFFRFLGGFFIGILAKADGIQEIEEDVDAAGHRAGIIHCM